MSKPYFENPELAPIRRKIIKLCLSYPDYYEDYPFSDDNWCVIRHRSNKKIFAWIFEKDEQIWLNVKCDPEWIQFWRDAFESVIPAYHMNKKHWNSIILDDTIPENDINQMVGISFDLTKPKNKRG